MSNYNLSNELSIKILNNPNLIIKYLQIGISIPILPEFNEYILHDINYFQAKSMLLEENGNPIGHSLLYDDGGDILYFGYVGVLNHNKNKISFLVDRLINYAKENNYKLIRGPINIPVIILGWGFMKEGSLENLFIGKPVNPPIYQDTFVKKGFLIAHEINTWEGSFPRLNPWKMKQYNFNDYEYFNPIDLNDFMNYKSEFLRIHAENLPPSSRFTPNVNGVIDKYAEFAIKYGFNFMIFFVKYKPTNKIVACGAYLPNLFRTDDKGNYDSCVVYTWAVESDHRRNGLTMLMFGATSLLLWKKKIRYSSGPIGSDNLANTEVAKKLGALKGRTHLILEYRV